MNAEIQCGSDFSVYAPEDVCGPSALERVGSFQPQSLNRERPSNKELCVHLTYRASFLRENKKKKKGSNSSCNFPLAVQATAQGPHLKGASGPWKGQAQTVPPAMPGSSHLVGCELAPKSVVLNLPNSATL